jgi:hypothetical protein
MSGSGCLYTNGSASSRRNRRRFTRRHDVRQRVAQVSATNTSAATSEPPNTARQDDVIPYKHIDITS